MDRQEKELVDRAIKTGILSARQLADAVKIQDALRTAGVRKTLGEILERDGIVPKDKLAALGIEPSPAAAVAAASSASEPTMIQSGPPEGAGVQADPLVGLTLKGFRVEGKIGEGGMGAVYRAKQMSLGRPVALKVLSPKHARESEDFVARFEREARAAARLNHPHVVQPLEIGSEQGYHFYAMEFCEEGSVASRIDERGRFGEREALDVVKAVGLALGYAAELNMVHRDIKPDNILFTRGGIPKLADLGLAKELTERDNLTRTGLILGTPSYMSPEQALGRKDLDIRSDIYSLGIALYEMLTGRVPFKADSALIVLSMHLNEPLPDPRKVVGSLSDGIVALLRRMTAKEADDRQKDAETLVEECDRLLLEMSVARSGGEKSQPQRAEEKTIAEPPRPRSKKPEKPPPAKPEKAEKPEKPEKPEKSEKSERPAPEKPAKASRGLSAAATLPPVDLGGPDDETIVDTRKKVAAAAARASASKAPPPQAPPSPEATRPAPPPKKKTPPPPPPPPPPPAPRAQATRPAPPPPPLAAPPRRIRPARALGFVVLFAAVGLAGLAFARPDLRRRAGHATRHFWIELRYGELDARTMAIHCPVCAGEQNDTERRRLRDKLANQPDDIELVHAGGGPAATEVAMAAAAAPSPAATTGPDPLALARTGDVAGAAALAAKMRGPDDPVAKDLAALQAGLDAIDAGRADAGAALLVAVKRKGASETLRALSADIEAMLAYASVHMALDAGEPKAAAEAMKVIVALRGAPDAPGFIAARPDRLMVLGGHVADRVAVEPELARWFRGAAISRLGGGRIRATYAYADNPKAPEPPPSVTVPFERLDAVEAELLAPSFATLAFGGFADPVYVGIGPRAGRVFVKIGGKDPFDVLDDDEDGGGGDDGGRGRRRGGGGGPRTPPRGALDFPADFPRDRPCTLRVDVANGWLRVLLDGKEVGKAPAPAPVPANGADGGISVAHRAHKDVRLRSLSLEGTPDWTGLSRRGR